MSINHPFAVRLRELRTAANLTQQELADRAGLHRQSLTKLELGEREPAWATVQALAKALGVNCLAFDIGDEQPPTEEPARPRGRPRKDAPAATTEPASKKGKGRK